MSWIERANVFIGRLFGHAEVKILAPFRPSRARPDPKPPHHRRANAVRQALASAPPGASYRQLIAHVRQVTGTGCSLRTVYQWKREQESSKS
jgi:hypothetical protein